MNTKKLIGYKLIKPEYEQAATIIGMFHSEGWTRQVEGYSKGEPVIHNPSRAVERFIEAKVLDLWFEPIYEKEVIPKYVKVLDVSSYIYGRSCGESRPELDKIYKVHRRTENIKELCLSLDRGWLFLENPIINKDYIISTKAEFDKQNQPKFEVGKWYKVGLFRNSYAKCSDSKIANNGSVDSMICDQAIVDGRFINRPNKSTLIGLELLTDLTEIQQYLPEGHVDKIVKEYIPQTGDWVVILYTGFKVSEKIHLSDVKQVFSYEKVQDRNKWVIQFTDGSYGHGGDISETCFRKALNSEIPVKDWSKATEEELLTEAERRYPIGTEYKGEGIITDYINTSNGKFQVVDVGIYCIDQRGWIFYEGKWAEILKKNETKIFTTQQEDYIKNLINNEIKKLQ